LDALIKYTREYLGNDGGMKKKKILIFTGNRAEYGLIYPLLVELEKSPHLAPQLLVSGAHLNKKNGRTISEIHDDGFSIADEVVLPEGESTKFNTTLSIGIAVKEFATSLQKIQPDIFVVYADRSEGFAAVIAATQMAIPTCHIEGGDLTEGGALDDNLRHAMTKLSHIHCATNEQSYLRIIALGEEPWRVHNIGFPPIDLIVRKQHASKESLLAEFKFSPDNPIVLFTQHSIATETEFTCAQVKASLDAIQELAMQGNQIICTYPNNDPGSDDIIRALNEIDQSRFNFFKVIPSLGRRNYHGILGLSQDDFKIVCIGNTSSGIKETAAFRCPTINIGTRQNGRLHADNVIHTSYDKMEILAAFNKCLHDKQFNKSLLHLENPYGYGGAGKKFRSILENLELGPHLIKKKLELTI